MNSETFIVFLVIAIIIVAIHEYVAIRRIQAMPEGPDKDEAIRRHNEAREYYDDDC